MAKRGNFTTVSRSELAAAATVEMTARAAQEETQLGGTTPSAESETDNHAEGASATGAKPKGRTRKVKRVCAVVTPSALERHKTLMDYRPGRLRWNDYRPYQAELVSMVERMDFTSAAVDGSLLSTAARFLHWRLQNAAPETLWDALTEENLQAFGTYLAARGATSATAVARLRSLRRGGPMRSGHPRKAVREPHSPADARSLWDSLSRIPQERAFEGMVLRALTFGLGLTAQEAQAATADWLVIEDDHTYLTVPYETGEFRVVPVVDGPVLAVLRQAASLARQAIVEQTAEKMRRSRKPVVAQEWLLSPHMLDRGSVITCLKVALKRVDGVWEIYDAARARSCWLVGLLESPMPFSMVCQIAGLNPGTKTPTDLLTHLPEHKVPHAYATSERLLKNPGRHLVVLGSHTQANGRNEVN